ncbi:MAG: hypothetical protein OQK51_21590 [Kangiellaceae bacterium]|nr:hypothetical protein [Kangiellaceae bacterium]
MIGSPALAFSKEKIALFYPEAKNPYRTIYEEIISGSEADSQVEIEKILLKKGFDADQIADELRSKQITKVIVLGRQGFKLAKQLPKEFHVVSGALPIRPNGVSGVSLRSDPQSLFAFLEQVAPTVKRVHVAYSERSSWIITIAKKAAVSLGIDLIHKKVANTAEAISFYNKTFEQARPKEDAIWLPLDKVSSHDKVTLPLILEKAWSKEVVVFSSKPSHAKRGALFSTYPDNVGLGKHLLKMVNELAARPEEKQFAALQSLQLAVNLRTAAHLGLKYSNEQQQNFKVTFPE